MISLCMIVKDEATTLARTLESVQGVVGEIVVVDTGSVDDTVAIAQSHGAKVHSFDWGNDFAAARNESLRHATGDWVLVLDADEVLLSETAQVLKQLDQGQPLGDIAAEDVLAVNLLRLELGAPQAPYTLITRCFRRLPEITFNRPYHETVDDSVAALQAQDARWQVVTLGEVALHHTGYDPAVVVQRGKFDRARTAMEGYLAEHPNDGYLLNKLAALYVESDQAEMALPLLDRALAQAGTLDELTRYELHYHRGLAQADRPTQAASDYEAALAEAVPPMLKLGAWINYGSLKKAQGDLEGAIELFQQAIEVDPNLAIAHYNLGTAHRARGYLDEAIAAYRQAIALNPSYAEAHQNLGVALFKLGQLPEALQSFKRSIALYEVTDPATAAGLRKGVSALGISPLMLAQAGFM
ncbi:MULTISPECIES: tetratricopeptide repeat protein [Cyanophyceae]|uniref:tetratricopeptide repeat protein n=1 Tax=Cyanophyceae TaxID=3028117 RepID=UPI001688ADA5|nr:MULTISPECIES: tetratricopeptide repeat protein [Cyanophyceae]MBD1918499.1 tetratricopeptide repeat protein [Phormidium sp. FACHB-77]MBD2031388.1 tetratricopeptide repeat protein [Phormidium sp. FACHB-322]MBD2049508.1 tetratricopeptide repeat protein [Leptolyngbya sp. FACHB-60]